MNPAFSPSFPRVVVIVSFSLLLPIIFGVPSSFLFQNPEDIREATFVDGSSEAGLHFHHFIGATGEFYMPEIMGSGVALFDYDNDGDPDIFILQGALLDPQKSLADLIFPPPDEILTNRLYRNLLVEEGRLKFVDVTAEAGLVDQRFGMGVAVGDYDGDGFLDLYVTNFGSNILYRNNGDGTFTNVTAAADVDDPRLSTGATFFDFDNDGTLDLFVLSYVDFTIEGNKDCWHAVGVRDYCLPAQYNPLPDRLFRNEGNGRFTDVTQSSGVGAAVGAGLGIAIGDFNSDGWLDVYVANDGTPNHLWLNRGHGRFEEVGLMAGVAYNGDALVEAGMGVSIADLEGDGHEDIFVTNLTGETNTLYRNDGLGNFSDVTRQVNLSAESFPFTGFGTSWLDVDNNGELDLFVANGAVRIVEALRQSPFPYGQRNQLFRNLGSGRFAEFAGPGTPALHLIEVSRGVAVGDVDNNGTLDLVVTNNNGPVRLLLNRLTRPHSWIQVSLQQESLNRFGIGGRVGLIWDDRSPDWRRVRTDGSYLSASDIRVHFGVPKGARVQGVVVHWPEPDPAYEFWEVYEVNQHLRLRRNSGTSWKPSS